MSWSRSVRSSFRTKLLLALALAGLADLVLWGWPIGSTLGGLAAVLVAAAALAHPAIGHDRRAMAALLVAAVLAGVLFERPSPLGWGLFGVAVAVAALSPRSRAGQDAWQWALNLAFAWAVGLAGPLIDWANSRKLSRRLKRRPRRSWLAPLPQLALPLGGGLVFLGLFAMANPVIGSVLSGWNLGEPDPARCLFFAVAALAAWMMLRPRFRRAPLPRAGPPRPAGAWAGVVPVGASLVLFNALFALENGLDIAFLWSGAALPKGVTLADYAHRGAYTLILTAILAGGFVVFALRPGAASARSRPLRALVVAWVMQNLMLVASSALRTIDYIQAYSLTRLRIAALIWMGLVAIGLMLICWRLLRNRSSSWLINANVAAAGLVLAACSIADLGAAAAAWNVRHAAEAGGGGPKLDLDYLARLGPAAVAPLSELISHPLPPAFRLQAQALRLRLLADLRHNQGDWHAWTWRGQRRLERAERARPPGGLVILAAVDG